ncbi:MAG: hypothetical protein NT033_08690 [Candidatus Omnitrophica bacterium]|nr:hypothetical protein [Candidatus Omnitrophota bacterium]
MNKGNEEFEGSPEKQLITLVSIIGSICLLVVILCVIFFPFFLPKPESPTQPKENHKKPEQGDYKKVIEDSKSDYQSFMEKNKSRTQDLR